MNKNAEKQKTRISDCFEKHFRHYGFRKTTVDEVADELGMSKKTIYTYFTSKEDIFTYLIRKKAHARRAMIEKEIEHLPTAGEKLEATLRINFSEFRKIHRKKKFAPENRQQSELASGIFRKVFFGLLKEIIMLGTDSGEFETCHLDTTVKYIQALTTETMIMIVEESEPNPEENLFCCVKRLLYKQK